MTEKLGSLIKSKNEYHDVRYTLFGLSFGRIKNLVYFSRRYVNAVLCGFTPKIFFIVSTTIAVFKNYFVVTYNYLFPHYL